MLVRCVTAGTNPNGDPDFHSCKVDCDDEQYEDGEHYLAARRLAIKDGYDGEMVTFDEHDSPDWLMGYFIWDLAPTVTISETD